MSKKYYAVKKGYKVGVFDAWDICKAQVNGFSGAEYKSFKTEEEAYAYIGKKPPAKAVKTKQNDKPKQTKNTKSTTTKKASSKKEKGIEVRSTADVKVISSYIEPSEVLDEFDLIAFVDGSYDKNTKSFGSGIALLYNDNSRVDHKLAGHDKFNQWNIVGELEATKYALKLASEQGHKNVCIYHDLVNIAHWSSGYFKAKNEYTIDFVRTIEKYSKDINITFIHVPAHSGYELNERADKLAKESIEDYLKVL